MLFKGLSIFSSGSHFVQLWKDFSNFVEGHPRNISVRNYFEIGSLALEEMSFKEIVNR